MSEESQVGQDQVVGSELIPADVMAEADRINAGIANLKNTIVAPIRNDGQYEASGANFRDLGKLGNTVERLRKEVKAPYLEKGKRIDQFFNTIKTAITSARNQYNREMVAWQNHKAEQRRKEQARLQAEADERRRREEERARKEREKAEGYRQQGRWEMASKAEGRAEAREEKADMTVAPTIAEDAPKAEGTTIVKTWKGQITDEGKFVEHMAKEGRFEFLKPDTSAWNRQAKVVKRALTVPGGRIYCEQAMRNTR